MSTTNRKRRASILLAGLISLGIGFGGHAVPAGAEIDDLCGDVVNGCPDEIDDFAPNPEPEPDPELPEAQPEPEAEPEDLPDAEVDGTVIADANFTG